MTAELIKGLREHIADMKNEEARHRDNADALFLRSDEIQKQRLKLENRIDQIQNEWNKGVEIL